MEWSGEPPKACDVCYGTITTEFIDGQTRFGVYGFLCPRCHQKFGRGLGVGRGQKFVRQGETFVKVEG